MSAVRWGILSTGNVAHDFALALKYVSGVCERENLVLMPMSVVLIHMAGAQVRAVSSRSIERAEAFAKDNGLEGVLVRCICQPMIQRCDTC
jgi:predicted dehydrogenase